MSWFHHTKQEWLQRSHAARREHAEEAKKHTSDNIFMIPHEIAPALNIANDEEQTFEEYFGEKMPSHVLKALDMEISLWQHLDERIADINPGHLGDAEYERHAKAIRMFLVIIVDLLHAEDEMLGSCLQQHYLDILLELHRRAAAVPL